jgi:K+/H+ antiporter YhaU regulatory subunit KhtT
VGIRRANGELIFNPSGESTIEGGDMLISIGSAEALMKLNALARAGVVEVERVPVVSK